MTYQSAKVCSSRNGRCPYCATKVLRQPGVGAKLRDVSSRLQHTHLPSATTGSSNHHAAKQEYARNALDVAGWHPDALGHHASILLLVSAMVHREAPLQGQISHRVSVDGRCILALEAGKACSHKWMQTKMGASNSAPLLCYSSVRSWLLICPDICPDI